MESLTLWLTALAAAFAAGANAWGAWRTQDNPGRRMFHALITLVALVFSGFYLMAATGIIEVSTFTGMVFIRPGLITLMAILGTYAIAYIK